MKDKNTIEDLMFLFGWSRGSKYGKVEQIKIQAENAWMDGENADSNPYAKGSVAYNVWYERWLLCNKA